MALSSARLLLLCFFPLALFFTGQAQAETAISPQTAGGAIIHIEITHASHLRSPCPVLEPEDGREHHVVLLFQDEESQRALQPEQVHILVRDAQGAVLLEAELEQVQAFGVTSYCQFISRDSAKPLYIEVSFENGGEKSTAVFDIPAIESSND